MDYDLDRLGSREFEHLVQSLAKCVLGSGTRVFGDGRDGGREVSFRGRVPFPHLGQEWNGYGVVQAKCRQLSRIRPSDSAWLEQAVRKEFEAWASADSRRGEVPEFIIFATNVRLTAAPGAGGIDRMERFIAHESARLGIALKGWAVWHRDEICRFLDMHPGVRRSYRAFLTVSDALADLMDERSSLSSPADTAAMMRAYAAGELVADQWLRLGQAGAEPGSGRIGLGPVAVDLEAQCAPSSTGSRTVLAGRHVIERGDSVMRLSGQSGEGRPHILLVGGPGQGKTTLGQLVCQAYRVAMFDDGDVLLTAEARGVLRSLRQDLSYMELPVPRCRRWPVRVPLHAYARAVAEVDPPSLLQFVARQVSRRTGGVTDAVLKQWLRDSPWLLVLDGLDEVARPAREAVMQGVADLIFLARSLDADLLVVGTTRPQGYHGEFHPEDFECLRLADMSEEDALRYAGRLARARHQGDPEMYATVVERIAVAAGNPTTRRLMRSPLQVTIMSLLTEKRLRMPQNRYELFEAYYATVYTRETDKPGPAGQLLAENRSHVDWMHQYAGLTLQTDEAVTEPIDEVTMPMGSLRDRLRARLVQETEDPRQADDLSAALAEAALDRLVLLVSPQDGAIGFEVKSLQEYCAAWALLEGPDARIVPRLGTLASDKTWYQAWLLAAAGLFNKRRHLRGDLLAALRDLDGGSAAHMLLLPGAHLALAMLDEDLARQHPKHHTLLVQHAAELITAPTTYEWDYALTLGQPGMARTLAQAAGRSEQAHARLENAARVALGGQGLRAVFCLRTLAVWSRLDGCLGSVARQLLGTAAQGFQGEQRAAAELFRREEARGFTEDWPSASDSGAYTLASFVPRAGTPPGNACAPTPPQEAVRWVADWAACIPVTDELVDGVAVPLVDRDALSVGPVITDSRWDDAWLPEAQRLLAETAMAQPATNWSIAQALVAALYDIASWEYAPFPITVAGINS
ncbi:NACHT domain-containing protein [Kitasatospora sp. NPDC048365]|uniref:NACHT domain-containing protein n=1 Tax=Kitasatospora sp. NPDC048365 TaxID=3364050 RepID=UPI0037240B3A